jgi:hypothetical protein
LRWRLFLVGLSSTLISIPAQTLALEALTGKALTKASSLALSTKLIFSSIGVAVMTTLLIDRTRGRAVELTQHWQALVPGAKADPRDPHVLGVLEGQIAAQSGAWAIHNIFWLICVGSVGLLAIALLLPGRRRQLESRPVVTHHVEAEPVAVER